MIKKSSLILCVLIIIVTDFGDLFKARLSLDVIRVTLPTGPEIPFRIGTLSRWVRAAASHPPSLDPDASGEFEGGEIPPQAIQKNTPYKRGTVSTLRLDNLHVRAAVGSGDASPAGVQGRGAPARGATGVRNPCHGRVGGWLRGICRASSFRTAGTRAKSCAHDYNRTAPRSPGW